jgi:NAD(P)H-hydrate epimerase
MVFGGSNGLTGAPLMAARAGARTGAGIVVCSLPGHEAAAAASGAEIVTRAMPATEAGDMAEDAARVALKDITRFRALAIGPGLGRDDRAQAVARRLVAEAPIPHRRRRDVERAFVDSARCQRPPRIRSAAGGAHAARR